MKLFAAFTLLFVGIGSFSGTDAFVTDQIVAVIDDAKQTIKGLGLDPLIIKREAAYYGLPVPVIFNTAGLVEDVLSTGLSDIVINDIEYDVLGFRLTFDIEMPHVHLTVGSIYGEAVIFDNKIFGEGSGSIDIYNARVRGVAQVGILGGIGIRSLEIDSSIAAIDSNVTLGFLGIDVSDYFNTFVGETLLNTLEAFKAEIDELISILVSDYINNILG